MEVIGFLISILLGALIGLQREYEQQHTKIIRFAGIRTFILITFFGSIIGFLSINFFENNLLIFFGFISVSLFAIVSYLVTYLKYKDNTATTEISAILVFVIGVMTTIGFLKESIIFAIIVAIFLTFKTKIHRVVLDLKKKELFAIMKFAVLSMIILPLLPNKNYSPVDMPYLSNLLLSFPVDSLFWSQLNVFNPFKIWLMVILISGISFVGYFAIKFFGSKKGYELTGFFGGIVSSTAVTLSMSEESKRNKKIFSPFVLAVLIANSTMFVRILFEILVINPALFYSVLIPFLVMTFIGFGVSFYFLKFKKENRRQTKEIEIEQPFSLGPAIKFSLFFLFIIFISRLMQIIFGNVGVYVTSVFSGLADVDAITLTMSSLSVTGGVSLKVASISILLAAFSNTISKVGLCWIFGDKKFAKYVSIGFGIVLLCGGLVLFFI